ncbi:MAG: HD domain-containing phosphohydrolase [Bacillota bacterium]
MVKSQGISKFIRKNRKLYIYFTLIFILLFSVFSSYVYNNLEDRVKKMNREFSKLFSTYIEDSQLKIKKIKDLPRDNLEFYIDNDRDIKFWCNYNENRKIFCKSGDISDDLYNEYLIPKMETVSEKEAFIFTAKDKKSYLAVNYPEGDNYSLVLFSFNNFMKKLPRISNFQLNIVENNNIVLSNKKLQSFDFIFDKNKVNFNDGVYLDSQNIQNTPYTLHLAYSLGSSLRSIIRFFALFLIMFITLILITYNGISSAERILKDLEFLNKSSQDLELIVNKNNLSNVEIDELPKIFEPFRKNIELRNINTEEITTIANSYNSLLNEIYLLINKISLQNEEMEKMNEDLSESYKNLKNYENKLDSFLGQLSVMDAEKNLEEFSEEVLKLLIKLIPKADAGSIGMIEDDKYIYVAQVNYDDLLKEYEFPKSLIFTTDEVKIHKNLHEKYHLDMPQKYIDIFKKIGSDKIKASLTVGIKTDEVIGNIFIDSFEDADAFDAEDKKIVKGISKVLSIYYYLKISMEKIDESYFEMIKSLVNAVEIKDKYTRGHSERVADYSVKLAKHLSFSSSKIKRLREAALLHDIGKIGIDESILNKEGKLDDIEYEAIKMHSVFGWTILDDVEGLHDLANIVRYHHERWDGKGYPEALKGEKIPLESRIIAIFDAFDTILTARSYKKARDYEYALKEIKENAGSQFDPHLVEVFLNNVNRDWIEE